MMRTENRNRIWTVLVTFLMTAALVVGIAAPAFAAETKSFKDVPSGKWYTQAVLACAQKGYVSGYEDGTFRPDNKLTRAEMAVIMNKMLGLKDTAGNTFKDVTAGKWYTDAVLHCVKAGVMSGYSTDRFGTADTLTREQGAVILAKAFGVAKVSGRSSFADDKAISGWAVESVKAMAAKGLISGMGNNRFEPSTPLTRAQMCQIIYAAQEKNSSKEDTPSDSTPTPEKEDAVPTDLPNGIVPGAVEDSTISGDWDEWYLEYLNKEKPDSDGVSLIRVDDDDNLEVVVHNEAGAGNDEILTCHNGKLSKLSLNGTALAFVEEKNQLMVAGMDQGKYILMIYAIQNGSWTVIATGSYTDPADGPAVDENGEEIYENYVWNGKNVSEEEFFLALADVVDIEHVQEI